MKTSNLVSGFIVVLLSVCWCVCSTSAEDAEVSLKTKGIELLTHYAKQRQKEMAALVSYEAQGSFTVSCSDDYLNVMYAPAEREKKRFKKFNFHTWARGSSVKVEVNRLSSDGRPTEREVYFLDDKQLVFEVFTVTGHASILPRGENPNNDSVFSLDPAFVEYSFLKTEISDAGIPAMQPAFLSGKQAWGRMVDTVKSCILGKDGVLTATLAGASGYSCVELTPANKESGNFCPRSVAFFNNDGTPLRKVSVLDYLSLPNFGNIAKTVRLEIFGVYGKGKPPAAGITWDYTIDKLQINAPIDDDVFVFDPAAVDTITDEKGVQIKTPGNSGS